MKKTTRQWLKDLPEPYRDQALENENKNGNNTNEKCDSLPDALIKAFSWPESKEGYIYWDRIHIKLVLDKPLTDLKNMISEKPQTIEVDWQPIETAPRNEDFLAYEDGAYYKCWLYEVSEGLPLWSSDGGQPVVSSPEPSHWTRLPAPPQIKP
jgi:hypothetical protein